MLTQPSGAPPRVVCAPDSFKGTFSAAEVAAAMAEGVRAGGGIPVALPIADGGEGTVAILSRYLGGEFQTVATHDPMGNAIDASYLRVDNDAYIELAAASGIQFREVPGFDPMRASTAGSGELIWHAAQHGCTRIIIGVGGSATSDGGAGMLRQLARMQREFPEWAAALRRVRFSVLTDVDTTYEDAPRIFGPQKGLTQGDIQLRTRVLHRYASLLRRSPIGVARTGAGGGASGALYGEYAAECASGIAIVLEHASAAEMCSASQLVLTGEGSFDGQTRSGKAVAGVMQLCRALGVETAVLAGKVSREARSYAAQHGVSEIRVTSTLPEIRAAAAELTRQYSVQGAVTPAPSAEPK